MSKNEVTEDEYNQLIKELKGRDFDLCYLTFNDNFLTKENVKKALSLPDTTPLQFDNNVHFVCGDLKQIIARMRRERMNGPSGETQPIVSAVTTKMPDSKMKNSQMLVIGLYIAFAIAVSQVIASEIQKYFIDNSNLLSGFVSFVIIVVIFGLLIFGMIKIFAPFRKFLLGMFGASNQF
jgi:hypothetical protein